MREDDRCQRNITAWKYGRKGGENWENHYKQFWYNECARFQENRILGDI